MYLVEVIEVEKNVRSYKESKISTKIKRKR